MSGLVPWVGIIGAVIGWVLAMIAGVTGAAFAALWTLTRDLSRRTKALEEWRRAELEDAKPRWMRPP